MARNRTVAAHLRWVKERGTYDDVTAQDWEVLAATFGFPCAGDMQDFALRQQAKAVAKSVGTLGEAL